MTYMHRAPMGWALLAAVLASSCAVGSGRSVAASREVGEFDTVVLQTSGDVAIDITGTPSVQVEADDNVLERLTTDVVGRRLELGARGSFTSKSPIRYTITAATLTGVQVSGSGNIRVTGLSSGPFDAVVSGSGNIEPSGTCESLTVRISGSGNLNGEGLTCADGRVSVSGSGNVDVEVTTELDVEVSGSGNVTYRGDPSVTTNVTGSGRVVRR